MTDAVVTEAIGNSVIEQLRTKYVNAAQRQADLSAEARSRPRCRGQLALEMKEYERLMFDELGRIAEVYRSELDIAKRREGALKENFASLRRRRMHRRTRRWWRCASSSAKPKATALSISRSCSAISRLCRTSHSPSAGARIIRSAQPPVAASKPRSQGLSAFRCCSASASVFASASCARCRRLWFPHGRSGSRRARPGIHRLVARGRRLPARSTCVARARKRGEEP